MLEITNKIQKQILMKSQGAQ